MCPTSDWHERGSFVLVVLNVCDCALQTYAPAMVAISGPPSLRMFVVVTPPVLMVSLRAPRLAGVFPQGAASWIAQLVRAKRFGKCLVKGA